MPWVKVDAGLHQHPKVMAAGLDGVGLYVLALTYCGDYLTDGFVPKAWVRMHASARVAQKVTDAGLWRPVAAGEQLNGSGLVARGDGFYVPDFTEWNHSKAEVEAFRAKKAAAGRKGAEARWQMP